MYVDTVQRSKIDSQDNKMILAPKSVDNRNSTRVFFELLYKLQIIASGFLVYKFAHVEIHSDEYTAFKQHLFEKKSYCTKHVLK